MRRLLLALISFSLAAVLAMPVPAAAAAPDAPSNVVAVLNGSDVDVSWDAPASDGGSPITQYLVSVNGAAATEEGTGQTFTVVNPTPGSTVTVSVAARNLDGDSAAVDSNDVDVPPDAPSNVVVTIGTETDTTVPVSWTADDGGGTNLYTVSISPDTGGITGGLTASPALSTTFNGLAPSTNYTVTVVADNGEVPTASNTGSATTEAPPVVAPSNASIALSGPTSSSLVATFSADDGGGTNSFTLTVRTGSTAGPIVQTIPNAVSPRTITGLLASTEYFVIVSADNTVAPPATADDSATTAAAPVVPPSNVVVTIGTETETTVPVSWTSAGDPALYDVTISPNDGGGAGALTGSGDLSTVFTGLDPGESYVVTVTATNGGGTSGGVGNATTEVAAPVITSFTATADGSTAIDLAWTATDGGGTNAYTTAISPNQGAGGVSGSAATTARYTGLTPGQAYTVTLTATNAGGSDTETDAATTSAVAASAPGNVSAALGGAFNNFVTVSWDAPSDDGGSPITSYIVTLSNGESIPVNNPAARSTTFETLAANTTVTARVRAVTGAGNGAQSAPSNQVTTSNVPGSVTALSAEWAGAENINSIDVSWTAPSSTGGLALIGYVVDVTPALENAIPVVPAGTTTLTIGGLEQGTSYTVTVRAQNARGNSAAATSGAVLVPSTPGTVTDLLVQQSPPFSSGVILTWALPAEDGGSPITGYSIVVDEREPLIVGPTVTTASFGDLPVGEHNVTIRAITAAGLGATVTSPNFEVKAFAPFDSEEDFVTQLYTDFLRRTPDAGGLAFWTERVANDGSNVQEIVEAFMRSPEFAPRRSVARLYFAYFNRQPDKGGFDFWTRQISTGAAVLENASQSFAQSPEFNNTYGSLNDAEFIVLVYNNVLARRPDQGGFEFWLSELADGLPRGTMMTLFSESPENIPLSRGAVDVTVTYDGLLQREADVQGFLFWTGRVNEGNTGLVELIRQFYFSTEYAERVNR